MISPFNVLQAALFGILFAPPVMFSFAAIKSGGEFYNRIRTEYVWWEKVGIFCNEFPVYMYKYWDWKLFVKTITTSSIVFGALCVLGMLMFAGIQSVYL